MTTERFACEHDAQERLVAWSKEQKWKWHTVKLSAEAEMVIVPRAKRGRPKADEAPESVAKWRITVGDIHPDRGGRRPHRIERRD